MTVRRIMFALLVISSLTIGMYAQGGGRAGGALATVQPGNLIEGTWGATALPVDSRGWGWMTKAYLSKNVKRPLYNLAKENLLQDKQVTSLTISAFNTEQYCEAKKHWDYIWFEMQHSTQSFSDVQKMITACPGPGAAPMIRMPDQLEANIQKATDIGMLGLITPTVDDAMEARDAARFARYPPFGRRSVAGPVGGAALLWDPTTYRQTINDNFLVVVMLETLESIINADEIANTFGVDVVIQGNGDLSSFSGWTATDDRYQQLLTISRNATLRAGKYWGNAGSGYLTGNPLSPDTRFVQNGPARDGFAFPARGRGAAEAPAAQPGGAGGRGRAAQ